MPIVHVAPAVAKVEGVATTTRWRAEVTDLHALVRYVAEHKEWIGLIEAVMPALNSMARSQREALAIPGVVAVKETSLAVRS